MTQAASRCIPDPRSPLLITHGVRDMLRQRIYGLALGWEDLSDHSALRLHVAMQTAVGVDAPLASAPTLCRLESWSDRKTAWDLHGVLVEQFIAGKQQAFEIEVVYDRDVVLTFSQAGLVNADNLHLRHVVERSRLADVMLNASPQLFVRARTSSSMRCANYALPDARISAWPAC